MRYDTEIKDVELVDAEPKDIPDILQLIYEIASYEKLTHEVTATLESLHESLFVRKRAHVILAKYQEKTIGYMLYFFNYSTFVGKENLYLEDLFVLEQYRHMGIGKALFKALAKVAVLHDCKRIDWVCLNWNESSLKFYQSIHAKRHDEWTLHRLSNEDILELAK